MMPPFLKSQYFRSAGNVIQQMEKVLPYNYVIKNRTTLQRQKDIATLKYTIRFHRERDFPLQKI